MLTIISFVNSIVSDDESNWNFAVCISWFRRSHCSKSNNNLRCWKNTNMRKYFMLMFILSYFPFLNLRFMVNNPLEINLVVLDKRGRRKRMKKIIIYLPILLIIALSIYFSLFGISWAKKSPNFQRSFFGFSNAYSFNFTSTQAMRKRFSMIYIE